MDFRKKINLVFLIVALAFNIGAASFAIQEVDEDDLFKPITITNGSDISIIDCIGAAFKNSPKIRRQKYNLDIAKSNLGIAKAQYFPVIGAGAVQHWRRNMKKCRRLP